MEGIVWVNGNKIFSFYVVMYSGIARIGLEVR